jgi:maltose alpha-D-glucosyltransferase/alpha-amylase
LANRPTCSPCPVYGVLLVSADSIAPPVWHEETLPGLELRVLVLFQGWKSFFVNEVEPSRRAMATALHQRLIRTYFAEFCPPSAGSPARAADRTGGVREIRRWTDRSEWLLARVRVWLAGRRAAGLRVAAGADLGGRRRGKAAATVALCAGRVRARAKMGLLYDAFANEGFCQTLVKMIGRGEPDSAGPAAG